MRNRFLKPLLKLFSKSALEIGFETVPETGLETAIETGLEIAPETGTLNFQDPLGPTRISRRRVQRTIRVAMGAGQPTTLDGRMAVPAPGGRHP